MAIFIKLEKSVNATKSSYGKYYAKTVNMSEVHTEDIARSICKNSTYRKGEVKGILDVMVEEMTEHLQNGNVVVLDGFGRFRLVAESEGVDHPEEFNIKRDIKKVRCKFLPAGKRDQLTREITRDVCDGVTIEWAPK